MSSFVHHTCKNFLEILDTKKPRRDAGPAIAGIKKSRVHMEPGLRVTVMTKEFQVMSPPATTPAPS